MIFLLAEKDKHAQVHELSGLPVSEALGNSAPALAKGADDIYWVHQLHGALTAHGYYPDDDEAADWFYGDHTASAVTAFQACMLWLGVQDADAACTHRLICVPPYGAAAAQLKAGYFLLQAGRGLPETGVCDTPTWQALLGDRLAQAVQQAPRQVCTAEAPTAVSLSTSPLVERW